MQARVEVVAHKGLHTYAPENSFAAIEAALRAGLTHIEVDVRAAPDGRLFLLHDDTLNRTTNVRGRLRDLSAAHASRARLADGSQLPRLEAVLELGRDVTLYLDVKDAAAGWPLASLLRRHPGCAEVWANSPSLIRLAV